MRQQKGTAAEHAIRTIQNHGGIIRTADALRLGIHPRTLYQLRDSDGLVQLSRGVYHLASRKPWSA